VGLFRAPLGAAGSQVGVRITQGAARLLAGVDVELSPRWSLRVSAGAGLDVVRVEPEAVDTTRAVADPPSWLASFVARAALGVELWIAGPLRAFASVAVDVDPNPARYYVEGGGPSAVVLAAWPVRPALTLGVRLAGPF
jgi:hypothetical protein